LLEAADELHRTQRISDETWRELRPRFDDAQLVEIPFVVGNYTMLSMVANATDVPLEEGLPQLPDR
jgi:4-carboxymuconolactone decarboxylase